MFPSAKVKPESQPPAELPNDLLVMKTTSAGEKLKLLHQEGGYYFRIQFKVSEVESELYVILMKYFCYRTTCGVWSIFSLPTWPLLPA